MFYYDAVIKMPFPSASSTAIPFCFILIIVHSFGELVVRQYPPTNNGFTRQLTCVSEDDDAALIWNYNYNINSSRNKENIFTNFQPEKPTLKRIGDCAIWNSTKCLANWEATKGWNIVNSAVVPMGPVFDYRWEGFLEYVSDRIIEEQNYQYVGEVREPSSTALFSVRGLQDVYIFLCKNKKPQNGPCFWIIIGGWGGTKSTIRSCANGAPDPELPSAIGDCVDVAEVTHGAREIIDPYEWRTFRLKWKRKEKTIEVFKDNEYEPFLEGKLDKWFPASYISISSDIATRVRFHFYEYFLTKKNDATISTTEFYRYDKNFCVELLVGLCSKCKLDVNLVDRNDRIINVGRIFGGKIDMQNELLTWRSVRVNANFFPNFNAKLVKLEIVTILSEDGVEGQWAIDKIRTCQSVGGLRQSTITTYRNTLASVISYWPTVKCQKLSYKGNTIVGSISGIVCLMSGISSQLSSVSEKSLLQAAPEGSRLTINTHRVFQTGRDLAVNRSLVSVQNAEANESKITGTEMNATPFTQFELSSLSELLLSRKARQSSNTTPLDQAELEVYEYKAESNLISLRLSPVHYGDDVIDSYEVYISEMSSTPAIQKFEVSGGKLHCKLWDNAICFEDLTVSINDTNRIEAKVYGLKGGERQAYWAVDLLAADFANKPAGKPSYLNFTNLGNGIVKLKWPHPLLTYTKIKLFKIFIEFENTKLQESVDQSPMTKEYPVMYEEKEYSTELYLLTSSDYFISVAAINLSNKNGTAVKENISVVSGVAFLKGEKLQVTHKGTMVNVTVPTVENATDYTFITCIVNGPLTCDFSALSEQHVNSATQKMKWKAAVFQVNETVPKNLMIGANDNYNSEYNCSLHLGKNYMIEVTVEDRFKNKKSETLISDSFTLIDDKMRPRTQTQGSIWFIVVLPILAICLMALFIWHWKRRKVSVRSSQQEIVPNIERSTADWTPKHSKLSPDASRVEPPAPARLSKAKFVLDAVPYNPNSCPIKSVDFEEYTKQALASGRLDLQYATFLRDLTKPSECATLKENLPKNRYKNIIAYDHNRVVLNKIPEDPHSDYINASYVQGYCKTKAYIATQGPKPNTVRDFWRMIWQENVRVICMLANVTEGGKRKCEKYWPEVGSRMKYGDILVSNTGHEVFADYTFRTFKLGCQREKREVTHLHYTGWPDHGVPMYTQSLVSYLKKLQEMQTGDGPVVVHCSAGVGRTGTIILSDICLHQAIEEKVIDVPAVMIRMREDRPNMVDSAQQYTLVHLTIVESMVPVQTQVSCTSVLPEKIKELRRQLPFDIQRLNDTVWQDRALHAVDRPICPTLEDVVPDDHSGDDSEESSKFDDEKNSTNIVSVDGVKVKNQYIASRLSLASSVSEFWKLIAEQRIELVVILQPPDPKDPAFCEILPDESVLVPVSYILVETKSNLVEEEHFSVNKLWLTDTSEEEARLQPVTVLTCSGWRRGREEKPPSATALVSLWRASEKISRQEGPTLVVCHDGVTGCGLYLALSFLLERMAVERECDVISAVRAVRRSKPEFVQTLDQFEYLYDAAVYYIKCFETYANFS